MLAEHQLVAAARVRELLRTRGGAILADEVGLGKSYVAAAVARAWRGPVELVLPAGLVAQWRGTLMQFGVQARILTHDALASDPFMPDAAKRRLVIVDEAHAFRNPATRRYDALARRSIAAGLLLVTATPVCNALRDLYALVALLVADDALADRGVPSIDVAFETRDRESMARVVAELVIRRDAGVLPPELRFGELKRRVVRHPVAELPIEALQFPLVAGAPLLRRFLRRRLESSEAALLESVRRQRRFYERVLESGRALTKRDYRRAFANEEDADAVQKLLFWDMFAPREVDVGAVAEEVRRLDAIASAEVSHVKLQLLREVLTDEPTLIFTGSAATARYLHASLKKSGIATARDGRGAIEAFQQGAIDLLIATDLAGEGLNLQRAGVVIHYDLPWNPVRLDQRNGRAHRLGQTRSAVRAVYFLPEDDETRVVATIASKNRLRRRTLRPSSLPPLPPALLRPRVARDAAVLRLIARGIPVPPELKRRHKAGLERLIAEMSGEYLDERRMADLLALVGI
jgi:SNF2 family DNA or RNA helicase